MTNKSNLPNFKYNPNAYELDIFEEFEGTCECCGKQGNIFYQGLYCTEDVGYICPDCIASGEVANKFDGEFPCGYNRIDNPGAIDELAHRTPNFNSGQVQAVVLHNARRAVLQVAVQSYCQAACSRSKLLSNLQ